MFVNILYKMHNLFYFFNDTATTEIYTLSLHDALPIYMARELTFEKTSAEATAHAILDGIEARREEIFPDPFSQQLGAVYQRDPKDRKSTRLNSSHANISYAVFCLKKKTYKNSRRCL